MIDTPGLDDTGTLGAMRVQKAYQILNKTDIALLVIDASDSVTGEEFRYFVADSGEGDSLSCRLE